MDLSDQLFIGLADATHCTKPRHEVEQFISQTFLSAHDAKVESFCSHLLNVRDTAHRVIAAAGYNLAGQQKLFLEQYLDLPIEQHIQNQSGLTIDRSQIAEVGNLATTHAGGARLLIRLVTQHLFALDTPWVVFTATQSLINSFHKMGLDPVWLADANASRVANPDAWGNYYLSNPVVVLGNVAQGFAKLEKHNAVA